jgi:hypothetical protein
VAFPTTGILDDCNRTDENPLSDGGKWGDRNNNFDLALAGNRIGGTNSGALSSMFWSLATYGPDCEAYITVTTLPSATAYIRLWVRVQNPGAVGETGYMMQWSNDANGCRIFKETARETYTMIAQDAAARYTTNDQLGLGALGSDITVYKTGASVLTVNDTTTSAAGNLALGCRDTVAKLLNFGGGTRVVVSPDVLSMQTHVFGHSVW